jgi:hypothetical protein
MMSLPSLTRGSHLANVTVSASQSPYIHIIIAVNVLIQFFICISSSVK